GAGVLMLAGPVERAYAADATQVLYVPEFTRVVIDAGASLSARPFDPTTRTGGVLAFFCNGDVVLNGTLSAAGAGFPGGAYADAGPARNFSCSADVLASTRGAFAGAGVHASAGYGGRRGNRSNGGGGGVCQGAGGGGGSNRGAGAKGGRSDPADDSGRDGGGRAGATVTLSTL